jgi:hypothetical protein
MKVICINDKSRPVKIPIEEWIKEGEQYTVTKVVNMGLQKNKLGFLLKEVQLGKKSFPYEFYDAERFAPVTEVVVKEEAELEAAI